MIFQGPESKEAQLLRDFLRPIERMADSARGERNYTITMSGDEVAHRLSRVFILGTRAELNAVKQDKAELERERDELRAILWMIAMTLGRLGELRLEGPLPAVPPNFLLETRAEAGRSVRVKATVAGDDI